MSTLSSTEKTVLNLLDEKGEMYGLEMVKASSLLARGSVYVILDHMEDKGLILSRPVLDGRRLYAITSLGQETRTAI